MGKEYPLSQQEHFLRTLEAENYRLNAENKQLRERINKIIDDHALRDESKPNKPVLALWEQPLIIKELIEALERGGE